MICKIVKYEFSIFGIEKNCNNKNEKSRDIICINFK